MYRLAQLAKHKTVLAFLAAMVIGLVVAPVTVMGSTSADPFGVTKAQTALESSIAQDGDADFVQLIGNILNIAFGLLGIISVIIILLGGFKWMTAAGNDDKVGEARKTIFAGIIGLAIILSAWGIAKFVIDSLQKAVRDA